MVTTADTLLVSNPSTVQTGPHLPRKQNVPSPSKSLNLCFNMESKTSSRHPNTSLPLVAAFEAASVTCRIPHVGLASSATPSVLSATSSWQASPWVVDQLFPDPFPSPGSGNFPVACAEIRDSNIFLHSSTRMLCGLHSKMLSWRAETNLTPLAQHISHEGVSLQEGLRAFEPLSMPHQ